MVTVTVVVPDWLTAALAEDGIALVARRAAPSAIVLMDLRCVMIDLFYFVVDYFNCSVYHASTPVPKN